MESPSITCLIPSLGGGGAERQMSILIAMLNEHGIIPNVVTYYNKLKDYDPSIKCTRFNIEANSKTSRNLKIIFQLIKLRPKVLLSYTGDANLIAGIYKLLNPFCRVIVSERTIYDERLSFRTKMALSLYRFVDHIVPNTITQADLIRKLRPNLTDKIKTISNYTEIYTNVELENRKDTKIRIIIPARVHPVKNLFGFLKALSIVDKSHPELDYECLWFGGGQNTEYFKDCQDFIQQNGVLRIRFIEFSDNIRAEIRNSDIVCIPSLKEGFSNALAEGLCEGKALLASNVSDNVRMCINGHNGYTFNPLDTDSIANAIVNIVKDKRVRTEFSQNSKSLAQKLFDKDTFYINYQTILF